MNRAAFGLIFAAAAIAVPAAARAQSTVSLGSGAAVVRASPEPDAPAPQPAPVEPSSRPEISIGTGVRGSLLRSAGFDPYASNDVFFQGSVIVGMTVLRAGKADIMLSAQWDGGTRSASARGEDTSLSVHRFSGVAEMRYHLHRRFFLGAKLAPAAFYLSGSITDASIDRPLVTHKWTWGLDTTGGAGVLIGSTGPRGVKVWLTLDLGYTFAGEAQMAYAPAADSSDPRKYGSVMLPSFRPAALTSRLGMQVAF
jgi:hypothetical protein